ncbi:hypothetical protein GA388_03120 [Bacteroides xylanisolvens]|nr:hypothetical protein GA388_03120 [Bacteroides xylanisolvens]KAB6328416.1 hypothetical protein GA119_03035 [Bacteroides xylanisolvens]
MIYSHTLTLSLHSPIHRPFSDEGKSEGRGCVKTLTQPFFYAQSPDFLKPGLCYYPKFSYL